tara:strand:+ start:27780 stop:27995 length:216 start_codon:yes stop_codon:yes gene_type:complete
MSFDYQVGDKAVDKQSMRMGTIIDLVEEFNESGESTYNAAKIDFGDGTTEWVNGENMTKLLLEDCTDAPSS